VLDFSANHFELFGLPTAFSLDLERLSERYRSLQRTLHPDRFAAAGERERRLSLQASSRVNEAYRVLRDPVARARYLLSLYTGEAGAESETTRDMAFLMEQMQLRESLAGATAEEDPYRLVAEVMARLDTLSGQLEGELSGRLDTPTKDGLQQARELVRKLQFVSKCRREAERIEAELDESL